MQVGKNTNFATVPLQQSSHLRNIYFLSNPLFSDNLILGVFRPKMENSKLYLPLFASPFVEETFSWARFAWSRLFRRSQLILRNHCILEIIYQHWQFLLGMWVFDWCPWQCKNSWKPFDQSYSMITSMNCVVWVEKVMRSWFAYVDNCSRE